MRQIYQISLQVIRFILCFSGLILFSSNVFAQQISLLDTISVKSDNNLNSARIACAFGDISKSFADTRSRGVQTPDMTTYCVMVMREAAKRDKSGHLYSRMQPTAAFDEWKLILNAAFKDAPRYTNVQNVEKILNCELAFDAGYMYGSTYPNKPVSQGVADATFQQIATGCFGKQHSQHIKDALLAGIRIAQAHNRGSKILVKR